MGAVLAFTLASGVGVQAKSPEELAKVTQISQAEFEALKPDGEATLEQKRQVVGDILLEAGVPEFMVEKLDGDMLESLYGLPGFEVKTLYYKEESNGTLHQIDQDHQRRISEYNSRIEKKEEYSLFQNPVLRTSNDVGVEISPPGTGISSLSHVIIVGAPLENRVRLLIALAGWERSPIMRLQDFIGISSDKASTYDETAVATLEYTCSTNITGIPNGSKTESIEYTPQKVSFEKTIHGVGLNIQLPINASITNPTTGATESMVFSDIVLGLRVEAKSDDSVFKVVSNYFHKRLTLVGEVSASKNDIDFDVSPSIAYDKSNASHTVNN